MNVEKLMEQQVAEDVSGRFGEQELGKRAERLVFVSLLEVLNH